ncbi:MAG: hypothetical protein QM610_12350 [Chitinophagaceae bacterium]
MAQRKQPYHPEEHPDIPDLENRGWEAMRQLLDEHLPVVRDSPRVVAMYWRWAVAVVLLLLLGTVAYQWLGVTKEHIGHGDITQVDSGGHDHVTSGNTVARNPKDRHKEPQAGADNDKNDTAQPSPSQDVAVSGRHGLGHTLPNSFGEKATETDSHLYADNGKKSTQKDTLSPGLAVALPNQTNNKDVSPLSLQTKLNDSEELSKRKNDAKAIHLDVTGFNNGKVDDRTAINNANKENVEAVSAFRQRMTQALREEEMSDSSRKVELAKAQKLQKDSQLTAQRRQQLQQYFRQKEEKEKAAAHKTKVALAVLANKNVTTDEGKHSGTSLYNMPFYPAVSASVKISDKIGFSAGLGTAAPGNFTNTSIGGSMATMSASELASLSSLQATATTSSSKHFLTYSSSTANGVTLGSDETSDMQQVYYWQIPLLFDYYVAHSRLKFSAGTDFSIIQRVMVGNAYGSHFMSVGAYNSSGSIYRLRSFDPRLSIGAQYQFNRLLIGARFSRSFQPALQYNGIPTNGGNNQLFNFSLGYSFTK